MRKNPVVDKNAGDVPGLDASIAFPSSVQPQHMEMPEVNMTPNDGTQKDVSSPEYANGKDMRNPDKSGGSNPWPAMPGC